MSTIKEQRHQVISEAVRSGQITTQQQLADALSRRKLEVNQSTLSRDLTEMGIRKIGGRYAFAEGTFEADTEIDYSIVVRKFVTCGPHITIVRTATGQAQPIALKIDKAGDPAIEATVAGDDTILVLTRNRRTQIVALRRLKQWFGDKYQR